MILSRARPDRRAVLHGLAGSVVAPSLPGQDLRGRPTAFVAIGDWGRDGRESQSDVAAAMGRAAAEVHSRFVISVGDNFYPAGVRSVADPQWTSSFEAIYTARSLQTPWYAALGNHDYRGLPNAQVHYSAISSRWRMPSRYFTISGAECGAPGLDIFVIDTTPMLSGFHETIAQLAHGRLSLQDPQRQLAWLSGALEQSTAPWKIVVGHHPLYSGGHHGDAPDLIEQIGPLLEAHGVQIYLAGHDHVMQHIRRGRTDHICAGSGASAGEVVAVQGSRYRSAQAGFAVFALSGDTLRLEFRDSQNRRLHRAALPVGRA